MKTRIYLLALIGVSVLSSATTATVMSVKPQTPKSTIVKPIRAMFGIEQDIAKYVEGKVKEGYIVKSIAIIDDDAWSKGVIIMEKY